MYSKSVESILTFNILIISYFYWIIISYTTSHTGSYFLIDIAIILFLIGAVLLGYIFLLGEEKNKHELFILLNKKTLSVFFSLVAYCLIVSIVFILKPGGNEFKVLVLFSSLAAAFFVFLYPLNNKRYVFVFNILILITQIMVLYIGICNYYASGKLFSEINVFFSSTNGLASFAIVSFAFSILSCLSLIRNLLQYKLLSVVISLNILISLLIVILSYSRSAIAAFIIMFSYILCSTLIHKKTGIVFILKLLIIYIIIIIIFLLINEPIRSQIYSYFNLISKFKDPFLQNIRFTMWGDVFKQLRSSPDTFLFGEYEIFLPISNTGITHAHNSFVEIFRSAGFFSIFFFFLGLGIALLGGGFRFLRENTLIIAVLILLLIKASFDDNLLWIDNYDFLVFWAIFQCSKNNSNFDDKKIL